MGLIPEVMISPKTLNSWLVNGYGVDTYGYSRMVILDVDSRSGYGEGHIPGAYLLEANSEDLWARRSNGIIESDFQVPARERMDDIIRRTNIDSDAIVIITGATIKYMARAYFMFRYWGFPRQSLKVLNSTKDDYAAAGFALQAAAPPTLEPCQYSVCLLQPQATVDKFRASLQEMIRVAEDNDPETVIVDSRTEEEYEGNAGSTPLNSNDSRYAIFEGHIAAAVNQDYKHLRTALSESDLGRSRDLLTAAMQQINIDSTKTVYVYDRTGLEAAVTFLALDAVLNWPVKIYDGGWMQWGQLAGIDPASGGLLAENSPWRTDIPGRSAVINYNKLHGFPVATGGSFVSSGRQGDGINQRDKNECGKAARDGASAPVTPGY